MQQKFQVTGMSCAACSARVESAVRRLAGVRQVQVNLLTKSMLAEWDESTLSAQDIVSAVKAAGYGAAAEGQNAPAADKGGPSLQRFLLSLLFMLPLMAAHHFVHGLHGAALQAALLLPILWFNRRFFISGARSLLNLAPNMDALVALGAAAGIAYSAADVLFLHSGQLYLDSAGMILTLITLGKYLEARATLSTGSALHKLRALLPHQAVRLRDGAQETIAARDIAVGDTLLVRSGERIPADGTVLQGQSAIDESALTGESLPTEKGPGATVCAGTLNGNGALTIRADKRGGDGMLADIITLVGDAAASKPPMARIADKISGIFVPVVIGLSLLTLIGWHLAGADRGFAFGCAIAVLVISCPCALGLATPVAIMVGAGKGAENGILFRKGAALEQMQHISAVVFDKTGTLTEGLPEVTDILPAPGHSREELLELAARLESGSHHPLAGAVMRAAAQCPADTPADLQYRAGLGITATIDGVPCAAGNAALMAEAGLAAEADALAAQGKTPLFFARGGEFIGTLAVADPLKPSSPEAVRALREAGLRVLMMTGDNALTARAIAAQAGIDEYEAGVTPEQKADKVAALQAAGLHVAVVGDGINDAPALTRADVGIAPGGGTDIALDSADILLMRGDLRDVAAALRLSRAVIRCIRQNLFWAFAYNVAAIPLAAGLFVPLTGWQLNPSVAAAAMSLSSLCVVSNALRLKRLHLTPKPTAMTITINIEGMMCPHCEKHMSDALLALPGVTAATADHTRKQATLTTTAPIDEQTLAAAVTRAGYQFKGVR